MVSTAEVDWMDARFHRGNRQVHLINNNIIIINNNKTEEKDCRVQKGVILKYFAENII